MVSSTHVSRGLNAKQWTDFCVQEIGAGKGGGKADQANASIPGGLDVLERVVDAARRFSQTATSSS